MKKRRVKMTKALYLGMSILDISNITHVSILVRLY